LIFSGDSLKPFDDYYNLFPNLNKKQILKFEGDHIINQGNILPYIICNNIFCNNEILSFTNESMENDNDSLNIHYLLEYINQYYTLFKEKIIIKRTGIVVFFKSYNLMNKAVEYSNKNNILKIEKENLFFEKRDKTDNNLNNKNDNKNNIFISFEKNIEKNNNVNIFFGVIGSKSFEETNFKDDSCGLLILAGMPFPDINSFEIKEKMKFYDKLYNKKNQLLMEMNIMIIYV
jgi:chromosome transmission fidelity protein 1